MLSTHPDAEPAARRLLAKPRTPPLTPAQAETLAIVAYLQPVSRPEIARIRGVNAESAAATLLERGMIEEAGRSQFGAVLYRTTELFLRLFGLNSLDELPDVDAFDPSPELEAELRERLLRAGEARAAGAVDETGVAARRFRSVRCRARWGNNATRRRAARGCATALAVLALARSTAGVPVSLAWRAQPGSGARVGIGGTSYSASRRRGAGAPAYTATSSPNRARNDIVDDSLEDPADTQYRRHRRDPRSIQRYEDTSRRRRPRSVVPDRQFTLGTAIRAAP